MTTRFHGITACVFDAYGTLFDVHSAVGRHRARLGDKADAVSLAWRTKQLEYTWLRSIMDRYVDFWQVTGDGLDYALDAHGVSDIALREDLMNAYLVLDCYPEVPQDSAGLGNLLDDVISVDLLGIYKPAMEVYQQVLERLDVGRGQVSFQSSNAWDAAGAATFGFKVAWCNRFGQKRERLPDGPHAEMKTLAELPGLVLGG